MKALPVAPRLCVFDLDGTLVDSLQDIGETANECLELLGIPTHPVSTYRYMVGEGFVSLCERALAGRHPELHDRMIELARARYRTRALRHTRPYAGVPGLVHAVLQAGMRAAVLSNKPHDMTARIVEHYWGDGEFGIVLGHRPPTPRKPDPTSLLAICAQLGAAPGETVLVGDTPTDVHTARAAEAQCIAVTWGFRTRADLVEAGAEHIVDTPAEVGDLLGAGPVN